MGLPHQDRSALLIMDYQNAILDHYLAANPGLIATAKQALDAARQAGLRIIYVVIGFRAGYPEVSLNNKSFGAISQSGRFKPGSQGAEIHSDLSPREGDLVTTKHLISAFAGSDLEMLLRAAGIERLVLAGVATSGVVLSTLRQAADMDFKLTVLKDACLDADPAVHACLMDKVFPRQAEVIDVATWTASLESK